LYKGGDCIYTCPSLRAVKIIFWRFLMLSNVTKKLNLLARVIVPLFLAASFFGCSSALESGLLPGGAGIDGLSASFQQATPPALANTDWLIDNGEGADPRYIVINFSDCGVGKLLDNNGTITDFEYTYDPETGEGAITGDGVDWTFTVTDGVMTITTSDEEEFTANLIEVRLSTITGFVGNGPTPRYDYSSIDFETDGVTVQMTFADGTYPPYKLITYDGVSAGFIDTLGLFYLRLEDNVTKVVFPDFYGYHMGQDVVYTPSAQIFSSLEGSIWGTSTGSDTVRFSAGRAYFTGGYIFDTAYFYDGYQAGGAYGAGGSDTLGSFRIIDNCVDPVTMRFYVYQGTRPFDFTLQVPPPSVKLPGVAPAE
jgi:hypothetical protein